GGPDPPGGGVQVDHRLAVQVAAAFGVDLVLDVAAGQPRLLELLDRAGHVHRLAETGVGVDQTGQIGGTGDLTAAGGDLGQGGQADVGQTQLIGDHGPGDVHAGEALLLDQCDRQRGEGPRERSGRARGQQRPQITALLRGGLRRIQHQKSPFGPVRRSTVPLMARMFSRPSSPAARSGRFAAASRNRSISPSSTIPSARERNLRTYCSPATGRAPWGWAPATALSSSITVPSVRVMTTAPPKVFSARSSEW